MLPDLYDGLEQMERLESVQSSTNDGSKCDVLYYVLFPVFQRQYVSITKELLKVVMALTKPWLWGAWTESEMWMAALQKALPANWCTMLTCKQFTFFLAFPVVSVQSLCVVIRQFCPWPLSIPCIFPKRQRAVTVTSLVWAREQPESAKKKNSEQIGTETLWRRRRRRGRRTSGLPRIKSWQKVLDNCKSELISALLLNGAAKRTGPGSRDSRAVFSVKTNNKISCHLDANFAHRTATSCTPDTHLIITCLYTETYTLDVPIKLPKVARPS